VRPFNLDLSDIEIAPAVRLRNLAGTSASLSSHLLGAAGPLMQAVALALSAAGRHAVLA